MISLTDISQIPNLMWPSYLNDLLDSRDNGLRRRESHRFCRSNVPVLSPTPPEQQFRPVSAQHRPLTLNSNHQLFVRSRASATPQQRRWHAEALDAFQDRCEQFPRDRHLGHLEDHVPRVRHYLGSDLDQLLSQCGQRPVLYRPRQRQPTQEVSEGVRQGEELKPCLVVPEVPARQPRPLDRVLAFLDPLASVPR